MRGAKMMASSEGERKGDSERVREREPTMAPRARCDGSIDLLLHSYAQSNRRDHHDHVCLREHASPVMQSQCATDGRHARTESGTEGPTLT